MLEELLVRPPSLRTDGLMLLGPYANGKSMIAERFARTYLKATRATGEAQKVWVVQTREGAGLLNFYGAILAAFHANRTIHALPQPRIHRISPASRRRLRPSMIVPATASLRA